MIELKVQRPYIDESGNVRENLEKHYAEDESGVRYKILKVGTNAEYDDAVDVVPCKYTYKATDKIIEEIENGDNTNI